MIELSTLLAYLEDPNFFKTIQDSVLDYAARNDMPKIARDLYLRLFSGTAEGSQTVDHPEDDPVEVQVEGPTPPKRTFSEEHRERRAKKKQASKTPDGIESLSSSNLLQEIKRNMTSFEKSGQRNDLLEKVRELKWSGRIFF